MGTSKTKGAHEMKRFAMAQNQSNRTDAAACAPACSRACMGSNAIAMIMDAAILAVSIFVCLSVNLTVLVWLAALILVLAVRIMNQLNTAESRNAFECSMQRSAA
mgnify:CR=1 FL=1